MTEAIDGLSGLTMLRVPGKSNEMLTTETGAQSISPEIQDDKDESPPSQFLLWETTAGTTN